MTYKSHVRLGSLSTCARDLRIHPSPTCESWLFRDGRFSRAIVSWRKDPSNLRACPNLDRLQVVERLWTDFFSNTSQWLDNRLEKLNTIDPDFKHKKTKDVLWIDGAFNPPWVKAQLASLLSRTRQLDLISWNKMLARSIKSEQYRKTIEIFRLLREESTLPDKFTFIPVLKACANLGLLEEGRYIHTQIRQGGLESDVSVGCSLLNFYVKCGKLQAAWSAFNKISNRDVFAWSAMIQGCVKLGKEEKALELYEQMQLDGVKPNSVTFLGVLNACACLTALDKGKRFHREITQRGLERDLYVGSGLVDMYTKCGSIEDAWRVFSKMPRRNVVAWSAMILGYAKCGQGEKALELLQRMQAEAVESNSDTFVGIRNECASLIALEKGMQVHQ